MNQNKSYPIKSALVESIIKNANQKLGRPAIQRAKYLHLSRGALIKRYLLNEFRNQN
jgi:hypothetical protein